MARRRKPRFSPSFDEVDTSRCHWAVIGCVNPATQTVHGLRVCDEHEAAARHLMAALDDRPDDGA